MGQPEGKAPIRATRWIAIVVALLLVAGVAAAVLSRRNPNAPSTPSPPQEATDEGETPPGEPRIPDDSVHRSALAGSKEKSKWVEEVPGLAVSDLNQRQLDLFLSAANTQRCTCGCGYTLAGCRVYDSSCEKSGPRVVALLDSVRAGRMRDASGLRTRPPHPG